MNTIMRTNRVLREWKMKWLDHLEHNKFVLLLEDENTNEFLMNMKFQSMDALIRVCDNKRGYIERKWEPDVWVIHRYGNERILIATDSPLFRVLETFPWNRMYAEVNKALSGGY